MRLRIGDRYGHAFHILLNGVRQHNVVEADEEEKYVIKLIIGNDGQPIRYREDGEVTILQRSEGEKVELKRCLECPYIRKGLAGAVSCVAGPEIRSFHESIAHRGVDADCPLRSKPRTLTVVG